MHGGGSRGGFTLAEAERLVFDYTSYDSGKYYGAASHELAIGVGLFYQNVRVPVYDSLRGVFITRPATVLVLTHECDIEQGNAKIFNNDVLVAPLAPFENIFEELMTHRSPSEVKAYLGDFAADRILQLMYLPHMPSLFPNGAVLYLNRITYTNLAEFSRDGVKRIGALTGYGLQRLDIRLSAHFLREKADKLPLTR